MLTKKEIYFKAYKELEKRRLNRKITRQKNIKIAFKICPEIELLQRKMSITSINLAKLIYKKNYDFKKAINKIKNENLMLQNKIKNLLRENNMPLNFLRLSNLSFLPVNILWVYVWWPTSQITLSRGISSIE